MTLHDAYLSVAESLHHGGIANEAEVEILWVDSEKLNPESIESYLHDADGILIPGGFGNRGIEGKILAVQYAREKGIPYLGICLGMQVAMIEFARSVLHMQDASSTEFNKESHYPVIHLMEEQEGVENIGGTMRLGAYPCTLKEGSLAERLYGKRDISERHRHRYEVNNDYLKDFEAQGMIASGKSPDGRIVEMVELLNHPFFIATQAHPEFKSRPDVPHPLFKGLVEAALRYQEERE